MILKVVKLQEHKVRDRTIEMSMLLRIDWADFSGLCLVAILIYTQTVLCANPYADSERVPETSIISTALSEHEEKSDLALEPRIAVLKNEEFALAQKLIKDFPNNTEAIILLGDVHRRWGDIHKAKELWERALQMDPNRTDINSRLARLTFETDEFDKSISLWKKVLQINPTQHGAHLSIARQLIHMGKYQESLEQIKAEIEISGHAPDSYFLLGQAYEHLRDYRKAEEWYSKVIKLQPNHVSACYGLVTVYNRLQQHQKAKYYMTQFKSLKARQQDASHRHDPVSITVSFHSRSFARFCQQAAMLYHTVGNQVEVEILLKRAISLQPQDISSMEKLIALYLATDRLPEALPLCRQVQSVDPENLLYRLRTGRLLSYLGHLNEAEKAFEQAIAVVPYDDRSYLELARFYLRKKIKLTEARKLAAKAVSLKARPENYFVLAQAYYVTGDSANALISLERAMELDPDQLKYKQIYQSIRKREGLK